MTKLYWIIGNRYDPISSIDETVETKEQAEEMVLFYTLQGYDCSYNLTSELIIQQARTMKRQYNESIQKSYLD